MSEQTDRLVIRNAERDDLQAIVTQLGDDVLGAGREGNVVDDAYEAAFDAINDDARNRLIVAELDGEVVGSMQLTYIPGLGHHGAERVQVESVRVNSDRRGQGIGEKMMRWVIAEAKSRGCAFIQLGTTKSRVDAQRFYARIGFIADHEGMTYYL